MKPKAFPFICFFFVFIHTLPVSNLLALPKEKRLVIFENGTSFQARVAVSPQEQRVGLGFLPTNTKTALLFWYNSAQERKNLGIVSSKDIAIFIKILHKIWRE